MARVREVEFFSTSFLDLLSCGMGAVIVLMIIFVSQLEFAPKNVRGFYMVSVEIDETDPAFLSQQALILNGKELMRIVARGPGDFDLTLSDGRVIAAQSGVSEKLQTAAPTGEEIRLDVKLSRDIKRYGPGLTIQTSIIVKDCSGPQRLELATDRKRIEDQLPVIDAHFFEAAAGSRWVSRGPRNEEPWAQHWYRYRADGRFGYVLAYPRTAISVSTPLASGRLPASQSPRNLDAIMHMTGWAAQVSISESLDVSNIAWKQR